jgi:hypothetical protein
MARQEWHNRAASLPVTTNGIGAFSSTKRRRKPMRQATHPALAPSSVMATTLGAGER